MSFPIFPKRKADAISNGIFLIALGILFYTGRWWPGILFALFLSIATRQYLTGRRVNFFLTIVLVGLFGILTLTGQDSSLIFPVLLVAYGLYLIAKECFHFKSPAYHGSDSDDKEI